jgi:hypothetical protein
MQHQSPLTQPTWVIVDFNFIQECSAQMSGSKQYTEAAFPLGYTSGYLVALAGVTDALPIAAEEMSILLSPLGRRMVDDHSWVSLISLQISLFVS